MISVLKEINRVLKEKLKQHHRSVIQEGIYDGVFNSSITALKLTPKWVLKIINIYLSSHSFFGSGIWEWFSWAVRAQFLKRF